MWVRPHFPSFHHRLLLPLAVLGLMFSDAIAMGQTVEPIAPNVPELIVPENVACSAEYWIVSSRRCCQRHQTRCPQGTLDYFAADSDDRLSSLTEPAFLTGLRYDLPILFVVHGDLTSFEDVRNAAPAIVKWIRNGAPGQPVQIVFYTWPSDDKNQPLPRLNISVRGERAEFNGCYLAKLISQFPAEAQVSFFGHSFGTRVISATLHIMAGGTLPGCDFRYQPKDVRSYRAVFAAAAIDRNWLNPGQRYGRALTVTEWLLNLRNGADIVINLYPLRALFSPQALGRVGFSPRDRLRMGPLSTRIYEWDVTMGIGAAHAWSFYYSRSDIGRVIAPYLVYAQAPPHSITAAPSPKNTPTVSTPVRQTAQPILPRVLRDSTRTRPTSATRRGL